MRQAEHDKLRGTVGLFATCLIDNFRPNAAFAAAALLERAGYEVVVPVQTCCGQPNYNSGDREGARAMAHRFAEQFADCDYVVVPSCSCAAMVRVHYPQLFATDDPEADGIRKVAARTWELTAFLVEVACFDGIDAEFAGDVVLHDSCSGLRELKIQAQPRELLGKVRGVRECKLANPEICCGFGGLFSSKYPAISARIAEKKLRDVAQAGGDAALVSAEFGCLLHLQGKLHRDGEDRPVFHIAEVLAGMTDTSAND